MLVYPFELPAVLRGRKGTLVDLFDRNVVQKVRKYVLVDPFDFLL